MRTANPALNSKTFTGLGRITDSSQAMTIEGTVNKSLVLLILVLLTSFWVWNIHGGSEGTAAVMPWMVIGAIGGIIVAFVTVFKKEWAGLTAPLYALLEGLVLGGLSAVFEAQYPGIVMQAVGLTFGTFFCLLLAYKSRLISVTKNFTLGVVAATGGIGLIYLADFFLRMFGVRMPYIHENGILGIGISIAIVVVAALNLVLDFDYIEKGAENGAPKYMEWYGAFSLIVTLIWLYMEILRLLVKLRSRD